MQAHVYSCVPRHARKQIFGLNLVSENSKTTIVHGEHFMFNWQLKCKSDVSNYTTKVFFAWLYLIKTSFANVCIHRMHVRDHARHILRALSWTLGAYFCDSVMTRCD